MLLPNEQAGDTKVSACRHGTTAPCSETALPEQHVTLGRCDSRLAMLAPGTPNREQGTPCQCA